MKEKLRKLYRIGAKGLLEKIQNPGGDRSTFR